MMPPLENNLCKKFLPFRDDSSAENSSQDQCSASHSLFPLRNTIFFSPGNINICIKSGNSRIAISHILLYDNDLG